MKCLVTGATGFLGKVLCPYLKQQGHELVELSSANCDLRQAQALEAFNEHRFDEIYHLAIWMQAGDFCLKCPADQWVINQQINTHMLDWWHRRQPQAKLIAMGTSCSYDPAYPLEESYYLAGTPIESLFAYGMTKRMLLAGLISFHRQYGHNYLYLVPSTLYGKEGYHCDGRQLHFIFDLIRKIVRGQLYGEPVVLWGDGEQKRELVHVDDFVHAMGQLIHTHSNDVVNLGEGCEHSIREYAEIIAERVGYPASQIQYDTTRYVGARSKVLSIQKVKSLLPEYSLRDPKEGIGQIVDWLLQNPQLL